MSVYIIDGHQITITHPEKLLFPESGITKGDLLAYYVVVASYMVVLCKNRPVAMHRYVTDINHEGFFQKVVPDFFPSWISRITFNKREGGTITQLMINNGATLIFLVNQDCITPHIWLSRVPYLDKPDRLIFDLDPAGKATFAMVVEVAYALKSLLEHFGIISFCMTTGSRGLHVVVPLVQHYSFEQVVDFAFRIAQTVVKQYSNSATLAIRKVNRGNKVFIDIQRNYFGQMGVAPYAVRARPGAPVAMPVAWDELNGVVTAADYFTISMISDRLGEKNRPWKRILEIKNNLAF